MLQLMGNALRLPFERLRAVGLPGFAQGLNRVHPSHSIDRIRDCSFDRPRASKCLRCFAGTAPRTHHTSISCVEFFVNLSAAHANALVTLCLPHVCNEEDLMPNVPLSGS